jgi:hypothetical protein
VVAPRNYYIARDPLKPVRSAVRKLTKASLKFVGHTPDKAEAFLR